MVYKSSTTSFAAMANLGLSCFPEAMVGSTKVFFGVFRFYWRPEWPILKMRSENFCLRLIKTWLSWIVLGRIADSLEVVSPHRRVVFEVRWVEEGIHFIHSEGPNLSCAG